jgi:hypothetical protein
MYTNLYTVLLENDVLKLFIIIQMGCCLSRKKNPKPLLDEALMYSNDPVSTRPEFGQPYEVRSSLNDYV